MKKEVWISIVYFLLLIIAIPWYWPKDTQLLVLGLPVWVFVAILVSVLASIFTAFILLRYPWNMDFDKEKDE